MSLNNLFYSRQLFSKLIACSLSLGLLCILGTHAVAQLSGVPLAQAQNATQANPVIQQLIGSWRGQTSSFFEPITYIFTPEGKLFFLLSDSVGAPVAIQYQYRISPTSQPMQVDVDVVTPSSTKTSKTIFQFTADGKLRLEDTNFGQSRPTAFTAKAVLLQKISTASTLPQNTVVVDFGVEENKAQESKAKQIVGSTNKVEQANYVEHNTFITTIDEVNNQTGLNINPESENYRYQILPTASPTQSVMMTAQAKRSGLRSYTGAVFVVSDGNPGEVMTIAGLCETDKPSTTPPTMPTHRGTQIQCPAGSHSL